MPDEIELLSIDPQDAWTAAKQQQFGHLQTLTLRIIDAGKDVSGGMGADLTSIALVYAMFHPAANSMYHQVLQLAGEAYNYDRAQERYEWASQNNKLKTLNKLTNILKFYGIDTTLNHEKISDAESLAQFLPVGVDPNFALEQGFYPLLDGARTGYYFREKQDTFKAQSNFIMEPLMHVYSKTDNKRIIAVHNGQRRAVLDLPSRALISVEQFGATVYEEGNYMFWGNRIHLMKVLNTINDSFPVCYELKTLGWQPEGFFAWSNAIFSPQSTDHSPQTTPDSRLRTTDYGLTPFSPLGIAAYNGISYFSPSASEIYKNQRGDDDEYENDRYLRHSPSPITFTHWAALVAKVYPGQAVAGVGFVLIALFKDIVFKLDNNCPHLSCYGEKGSGKSKFAESLSSVFLTDLQPFNLNHGTEFAFFNRLSRFRNCTIWLDEFDDQAIREDRFQSIKGAYDGAGRERGKGTNKNRTEIARVNGALLLTGQYLSTRDDNAALTRCIVLAFTPDNNRGADRIAAYDKLKAWEKQGLSGMLTELLPLRPAIAAEYNQQFALLFAELRHTITQGGGAYTERVLRNYCALLNLLQLAGRHLSLPFTMQQAKNWALAEVQRLSMLINESDSLADFWNTVVYLMETGEIYEGFHYRILQTTQLSLRLPNGTDEARRFSTPTRLLALRLTTIHKLYLEAHRKQTGKTGINMQSLELYISSARGYMGKNSSLQFTEKATGRITSTSSYIFHYEQLGIPLEMSTPEAPPPTTITGISTGRPETVTLQGKPMLRYTLRHTEATTDPHGHPLNLVKHTTIYDPVLSNANLLLNSQNLLVTGRLEVETVTDRDGASSIKRKLHATSVQLAPPEAPS